jgi:hypothetical protein
MDATQLQVACAVSLDQAGGNRHDDRRLTTQDALALGLIGRAVPKLAAFGVVVPLSCQQIKANIFNLGRKSHCEDQWGSSSQPLPP